MGFSLLGKPGSPQRLDYAHDEFMYFVAVAFGFQPSRTEIAACTSLRETLAIVARHVHFLDSDVPRVARAEALVREALGTLLERAPESFHRDDRLDDLLPRPQRRELWKKLRIRIADAPPRLRRSRETRRMIGFLAVFTAIGAPAFKLLPWFFAPVPFVVVGAILFLVTLPFANRSPVATVGELIDRTAHEAVSFSGKSIGWTQTEAEGAISGFARDRYKVTGGLDLTHLTPDTPLPAG